MAMRSGFFANDMNIAPRLLNELNFNRLRPQRAFNDSARFYGGHVPRRERPLNEWMDEYLKNKTTFMIGRKLPEAQSSVNDNMGKYR